MHVIRFIRLDSFALLSTFRFPPACPRGLQHTSHPYPSPQGASRPSSGRRAPRATRNLRGSKTMAGTSTSGIAAATGVLLLPDDLYCSGGSPSGRAGRGRPVSGRSVGRGSASSIWGPKDLKSVLASGKWDSDEEGEAGLPPTLQLRRPSRPRGPGGSRASSAGGGVLASPRMAGGGGGGDGDEGGAGGDGGFDDEDEVYVDDAGEGGDEFDAIEGGYGDVRHMHPAAARLAALEGKYGRLRARYEEAMKALTVAFRAGGGGGGDDGGGGGALGLPPRAVLDSLSPAVRLRLIAELLAEVHREVEGGVWPRLSEAVAAALGVGAVGGAGSTSGGAPAAARASVSGVVLSAGGGGGGGGTSSRPASAMAPAAGSHAVPVSTSGLGPRPASGKASAASGTSAAAGRAAGEQAEPMVVAEESSLPSAESQHGSAQPPDQQPQQPQGAPRVSSTTPAVLAAEPTAALVSAPATAAPAVSAEAQELAGRLHAHAGVVGQAVAAAAVQAAALAAALEDLDSYGARRGASAGRRMSAGALWSGLRINVGPTTPGAGAAAAGGGPGSAAGSPRYGDGLALSGSQPGSPAHTSAMGAWPAGGAAAGSAFSLLRSARPSSGLSRAAAGGPWPMSPLALSNLGPAGGGGLLGSPRPGTAGSGAGAAGGAGTHRSGATALSGAVPGEGGLADADGVGAQQHPGSGYESYGYDPNEPYGAAAPAGVTKDTDPRDTMYLDALRALHLAAEGLAEEAAEADGAGTGEGRDAAAAGATTAVRSAVAALVALMGGHPRVTAHGRIIEFFPRRIPKGEMTAGQRLAACVRYLQPAGASFTPAPACLQPDL